MRLGTQTGSLHSILGLVVVIVAIIAVQTQTVSDPITSSNGWHKQDATPTTAPVTADDSAVVAIPEDIGDSARGLTATTAHMRLYTGTGATYSGAVVTEMGAPIEEAIQYVGERTGYTLDRPVNVVFDSRPGACSLDAAAYTNARTIFMYACGEIPQQRAINIMAHEIVHQLAHDRYGDAHLAADIMLSEGVATWGAGRYWLGDSANFHDFVASNYGNALLPLATDSRGASIATMNQLYYQWASFVEWIRATHGAEAFDKLYANGSGRAPGSAPYADTLHMSLEEAEQAWRTWLQQPLP